MTTNYTDCWDKEFKGAGVNEDLERWKPDVEVSTELAKLRPKKTTALDSQQGGAHYVTKGIQPIQYIHANNLGFCEGNIVKYATRWRDKNGLEDLLKIKHYVDLLIELENLQEQK